MAASVWMKFSKPSIPMPERPSALTIPRVTVKYCPKGFPNAMTVSPTFNWYLRITKRDYGKATRFNLNDGHVCLGICSHDFPLKVRLSESNT